MSDPVFTCPMPREQVIDTYFLEHRAKLIDVAAYLDRLDRAAPNADQADFRDEAFRTAIAILTDGETHRAKRILALLSDHTDGIPQSAEGSKGAAGAPLPVVEGGDA